MDYLDRNQRLLSEIDERFRARKGEIVGRSLTGTIVNSIGSFESPSLDSTVYVAFKSSRLLGDKLSMEKCFARDLAVISAIYEKFPELRDELPLFYILLTGENNEPYGTL